MTMKEILEQEEKALEAYQTDKGETVIVYEEEHTENEEDYEV